jgi:hypothetical protein
MRGLRVPRLLNERLLPVANAHAVFWGALGRLKSLKELRVDVEGSKEIASLCSDPVCGTVCQRGRCGAAGINEAVITADELPRKLRSDSGPGTQV